MDEPLSWSVNNVSVLFVFVGTQNVVSSRKSIVGMSTKIG